MFVCYGNRTLQADAQRVTLWSVGQLNQHSDGKTICFTLLYSSWLAVGVFSSRLANIVIAWSTNIVPYLRRAPTFQVHFILYRKEEGRRSFISNEPIWKNSRFPALHFSNLWPAASLHPLWQLL